MSHLDRVKREFDQSMQRFNEEIAMVEHGWRPWKPGASDAEKDAAFTGYLAGKKAEWYPPGYQEPTIEPIETTGKLATSSEPEIVEPRRKLFGLF
jgi:hypothetical protein